MAVIRPSANPGPQGSLRIGGQTLHAALLASQWVMPMRSFETLISRLFRYARSDPSLDVVAAG